jgi:hypothetical protein
LAIQSDGTVPINYRMITSFLLSFVRDLPLN